MGKPLAGWGGIQKAALDYGLGKHFDDSAAALMILIMIAIRLESKGPALFRQQRYGFINRTFEIYKFRTMSYTEKPEKEIVQATRRRSAESLASGASCGGLALMSCRRSSMC